MIRETRIAKHINQYADPRNLNGLARRLVRLSPAMLVGVLTARWCGFFKFNRLHPRLASMLLARVYEIDPKKAVSVAQELVINNPRLRLSGEGLLSEKGWVDLGIEILALGFHRVEAIDVCPNERTASYCAVESGRIQVYASAPLANQGHLIALKLSPEHPFVK